MAKNIKPFENQVEKQKEEKEREKEGVVVEKKDELNYGDVWFFCVSILIFLGHIMYDYESGSYDFKTIFSVLSALFFILVLVNWLSLVFCERPIVEKGLNLVYHSHRRVFLWLGRFLARLSSFYLYLKLEKLFESFSTILLSLVQILTSPPYTVKGYITQLEFYRQNKRGLVILGSLTLLLILVYGAMYYFEWKIDLNFETLNTFVSIGLFVSLIILLMLTKNLK